MSTRKIIQEMGGAPVVGRLTGLSRGRISQWVVEDRIPRPWAMFLHKEYPNIDLSRFMEKPSSAMTSSVE